MTNIYSSNKIHLWKVTSLFLSFLVSIQFFHAQVNYVQNPSFEDGPCTAVNFLPVPPTNWDTLSAGGGGGPEYCTECSSNPNTFSPFNGYLPSFQAPKSGNRYCFFTTYYPANSPIFNDYREYIQNKLKENLKKDLNYCATFWISLMDESKYAITEFGAYFDNGSISTPYYGTSTLNPHVKSPPGVFLIDKSNWIKVQGVFTATGDENHLTLGNFKSNASTSTIDVSSTSLIRQVADYYVDDVSVIEADLPAYAGRDTVLCMGDSVFIGRPPEIGLECIWNSNGSQVGTGGGLWVKPSTTQTFEVTQDVCGLIKKDTIRVQIKPKYSGPPINLTVSSPTTCANQTINFAIQNNPPVLNGYNWLPFGVYVQTNNISASAVVSLSTTFTLNINNLGQDAFCPFQRTASVSVSVPVFTDSPILISNFNPVCPGDTIVLSCVNPAPGNTVTYQWLPASAYSFTNNLSAKSITQLGDTYSLNIISSGNASICAFTRSLSISVSVADSCFKDPVIPNIFTPNNDNSNDQWAIKFPYGSTLSVVEVYDRWGTLIYSRENLNFNKQGFAVIGWDGRNTSGEEMSAGVYFYVLQYTDRSGIQKSEKGNITLLK